MTLRTLVCTPLGELLSKELPEFNEEEQREWPEIVDLFDEFIEQALLRGERP